MGEQLFKERASGGIRFEQKLPLDGKDIWNMLTEGAPSPHEDILINVTPGRGALRMGDWKIVLGGNLKDADDGAPKKKAKLAKVDAAAAIELFNLKDDPTESKNLAAQHSERVRELRARLENYAGQALPPKAAPKAADFKSPKVWGEVEEPLTLSWEEFAELPASEITIHAGATEALCAAIAALPTILINQTSANFFFGGTSARQLENGVRRQRDYRDDEQHPRGARQRHKRRCRTATTTPAAMAARSPTTLPENSSCNCASILSEALGPACGGSGGSTWPARCAWPSARLARTRTGWHCLSRCGSARVTPIGRRSEPCHNDLSHQVWRLAGAWEPSATLASGSRPEVDNASPVIEDARVNCWRRAAAPREPHLAASSSEVRAAVDGLIHGGRRVDCGRHR